MHLLDVREKNTSQGFKTLKSVESLILLCSIARGHCGAEIFTFCWGFPQSDEQFVPVKLDDQNSLMLLSTSHWKKAFTSQCALCHWQKMYVPTCLNCMHKIDQMLEALRREWNHHFDQRGANNTPILPGCDWGSQFGSRPTIFVPAQKKKEPSCWIS